MLNTKQIRMLQLLDNQIQCCELCGLFKGGRAKPYWTEESIWAIVGEAPGSEEVINNSPFVGAAARHLWEVINANGLERKNFLIINSVNCRPTDGSKNLKPTISTMSLCRPWIRKYLRVFKPQKILLLGGYSLNTILYESGILRLNATKTHSSEFGCDVIRSVHPSMCIYHGNNGKKMLYESIKLFGEI